MKKPLLILLITTFCVQGYAQITFDQGYYIDNNGRRFECFIKNLDWKNNPSEFEYQLEASSTPQKLTVASVQEFGVNQASKFIRRRVNIDRSSEDLDQMSKVKHAVFEEEELFLKVLVEGKSNLYLYQESALTRFFYSLDNGDIEQLVYKFYETENYQKGINARFRQQLWNNLKCPSFDLSRFENLKYQERYLVRLFEEYSSCHNVQVETIEVKEKVDRFNLSIRPGLKRSALAIDNPFLGAAYDFGSKIGFRIGVEAEFVLPYNKNKWAIILEPSYQSFNVDLSEEDNGVSGGIRNTSLDYTSIEIPLGLRHYFFLNNDSKIFLTASLIFDLSFNSSVVFTRADNSEINTLDLETRNNIGLGVGYQFLQRYHVELRYQTNREVLGSFLLWNSDYESASVIFGYTIF